MELLNKVERFIKKHSLFQPHDKILVAISGGPDSVFLGYALWKLGYNIGLAHVNYHTRGEDSTFEASLIADYANTWKVPLHSRSADAKSEAKQRNVSFQVAARNLRYDFFHELITLHQYSHCVTAHHADDQIETILMALFTGNNPNILRTIPIIRSPFIRPLIEIRKKAIITYLEKEGLAYSLDYTNQENDYLRNKIRNQVLPLLRDLHPEIGAHVLARQKLYDRQYEFVSSRMQSWYRTCASETKGVRYLRWEPFTESQGYQYLDLLIIHTLSKWKVHGHDLWNCVRLIDSQPGKHVHTTQGMIERIHNGLMLYSEHALSPTPFRQVIHEPTNLEGQQYFYYHGKEITFQSVSTIPSAFEPSHFYLDYQKVKWPLHVRTWKQGDRMIPLGMKSGKKISDIFIDQKLSSQQKKAAIILEDQEGIICLSGFRISERVKIQNQTQKVLIINIGS